MLYTSYLEHWSTYMFLYRCKQKAMYGNFVWTSHHHTLLLLLKNHLIRSQFTVLINTDVQIFHSPLFSNNELDLFNFLVIYLLVFIVTTCCSMPKTPNPPVSNFQSLGGRNRLNEKLLMHCLKISQCIMKGSGRN